MEMQNAKLSKEKFLGLSNFAKSSGDVRFDASDVSVAFEKAMREVDARQRENGTLIYCWNKASALRTQVITVRCIGKDAFECVQPNRKHCNTSELRTYIHNFFEHGRTDSLLQYDPAYEIREIVVADNPYPIRPVRRSERQHLQRLASE
jgi:hypothetical protein